MVDVPGNGQGAAQAGQPSVSVIAQYVKDMSFENPAAPETLRPREQAPNINVSVGVQPRQLGQNDVEVELRVDARAVDGEQELAGNPEGPEGGKVPNLTPGPGGLGDWSESDIAYALKSGITPDGDFLGDSMGDVIDEATGHMTDDDLAAISLYLKELEPLSMP